jgi:hypothetical protein
LRAFAQARTRPDNTLTVALADAIADAAALGFASAELGAIPALSRRRLLAAYGALMRARKEEANRPTRLPRLQ